MSMRYILTRPAIWLIAIFAWVVFIAAVGLLVMWGLGLL